jgi:hypothetical protein
MDGTGSRQRNGRSRALPSRSRGGHDAATVASTRASRAVTTVDNPILPDHLVGPEERRYREDLRAFLRSQHAGDEDPWRAFLGPLLDAEQVRSLLGIPSLEAVDNLVQAKRVLALPGTADEVVYPAFQFSDDGQPYPTIAEVIEILAPVAETPYTIATWLMSPKPYFDGRSPMQWLKSGRPPRQVVTEARLAADHMAHS